MSRILLIRHAETDLAGTFCGHTDPSLNQTGHDQLHTLLQALHTHSFHVIYTSDLRRAQTTAEALAKRFVTPLITNKNLREIDFGDWESLTWPQIEQRDPIYARRWIDRYPNLPAPNGEPYQAFKTRVLKAYESIRSIDADYNVAIVTHAGVLQLLLATYGDLTAEQAWEQTRPYCCTFHLAGAP